MSAAIQPIAEQYFGDVFRGRKVLVTGNTGFKGSWLTVLLLRLGAKVYGLSKDIPTNPSLFQVIDLEDRLEKNFVSDVRDLDAVRQAIETIEPDFLFHLAAQSIVSESHDDPITTFSTNVLGTAHVLEALRLWGGQCTTIIITSDKCYENVEQIWGYQENDRLGGKDPYSGSKGAAEVIFQSYARTFFVDNADRLRIASARAGNVIGGGDWAKDRIVVDAMLAWSRKEPVRIRKPHATRPWQHVLEPLSGYLRLAQVLQNEAKLQGESFNFGPASNQDKSVLDLISALSGYWDFLNPSEAYLVESDSRFGEASLLKLNCEKALALLEWLPALNYEETARMVSEWYYEYYCAKSNMLDHTLGDVDRYLAQAQSLGLSWAPAD